MTRQVKINATGSWGLLLCPKLKFGRKEDFGRAGGRRKAVTLSVAGGVGDERISGGVPTPPISL
jgi:hypothetical protein